MVNDFCFSWRDEEVNEIVIYLLVILVMHVGYAEEEASTHAS